MSVVRVGATKQYSDNWDKIFSGGRPSSSAKATKPGKKSASKPAKKSPKKTAKATSKKAPAGKKKSKKK